MTSRWALGIASACVAFPAFAQTEQAAETDEEAQSPVAVGEAGAENTALRVYLPEEFARFAPRNALDLIEQIPGFEVQGGGGGGGGGNGGGRGFGQASENLLINGERISSKSTSTSDQLSRISVDNVIRIEVVDGSTLDIPGLSGRVANIIVERGELSGQFEWRPQWSTGPSAFGWKQGDLSISGSMGTVDYSVAFESDGFTRGSEGPAIFTFADGSVDERINLNPAEFTRPQLSGSFRIPVAPDVVANLNLLGGVTIFRAEEFERRAPGNPRPVFLEQFRSTNDEYFYELGGDIEFPFGPGRLKLIVLESYEDGEFVNSSLRDEGVAVTTGSRFVRASQQGERIGRGEYSWAMLGADFQVSGEAAFNRLDQVASLFGYDAGTQDYFNIPFPDGVGGVREERFEGLLSVGFPITGNLSLQLIGGGEYSTISQTGTNSLSRSFQRPKGSLSLAWGPTDGLDINLEIARRVGQLNFGDFLASVNLSDENQNAGNNELRPQQLWNLELQVAKNLGRWGSATLTVFDQHYEDFVLFVPVGNGAEARGNISGARRYGLRLTGTLELAPLGLPGAKIDARMTAEDSSLLDPLTNSYRRFDFNDPFEVRLDFRHDVPATDFAWGLGFRQTSRALGYRINETFLDHTPNTFGEVFVEHKDVFGATVRIRLANILDGETSLYRTVYDGPRHTSPELFTEDRDRKIGQVVNLQISGSF